MDYDIICTKCGHKETDASFRCGKCGAVLEVRYRYVELKRTEMFVRGKKGVARYIKFLPIKRLVTLGEGGTPLRRIWPRSAPGVSILLKLEMHNPTRTFKDRGSAVELSKAVELGARSVCCASTGNMGLSVAHYARHVGKKATIFISRDANRAKIEKIRSQGARIAYVEGDFNKALKSAEAFARKSDAFLCGDYHFRKEGQKTVIFEIAERAKGRMPDYLFVPVGNGTLFSGVHKGLKELTRYKVIGRSPRMVAVQSEMCDPVANAYMSNKRIEHVTPRTDADAIAVGYPTFGFESLAAIRSTKGSAISVSEDELKDAVRMLEEYGVYAELGGGAGFAGFLKLYNKDERKFRNKQVVIIITGNNEGKFV